MQHLSLVGVASALLVFAGGTRLLIRLQIDDVVNGGPVHFCSGLWSLFATGLFADADLSGMSSHGDGLFYGGGDLLGWQICGMLMITLWAAVWSGLFFFGMQKAGLLRVSEQDEKAGLDTLHIVTSFVVSDGTPIVKESRLAKLNPDDRAKAYGKMSKLQRAELEESLNADDRATMFAAMSDEEREKHEVFVFVKGCKTNRGIVMSEEPYHTRFDAESEMLISGTFVDVYDEVKQRTRECSVDDLVLVVPKPKPEAASPGAASPGAKQGGSWFGTKDTKNDQQAISGLMGGAIDEEFEGDIPSTPTTIRVEANGAATKDIEL